MLLLSNAIVSHEIVNNNDDIIVTIFTVLIALYILGTIAFIFISPKVTQLVTEYRRLIRCSS